MKVTRRRPRTDGTPFESPEAIRKRLDAFVAATRDVTLSRSKVKEPTVQGAVLAGPRIRPKS